MKKQASKRKPPRNYNELPELTAADFKRAKPASEAVPRIAEAHAKRVGRPPHGERAKVPLSLRIDANVLKAFQATGEGWQRRMGKVLERAAKTLEKETR